VKEDPQALRVERLCVALERMIDTQVLTADALVAINIRLHTQRLPPSWFAERE
jgi:hypothetical protein